MVVDLYTHRQPAEIPMFNFMLWLLSVPAAGGACIAAALSYANHKPTECVIAAVAAITLVGWNIYTTRQFGRQTTAICAREQAAKAREQKELHRLGQCGCVDCLFDSLTANLSQH